MTAKEALERTNFVDKIRKNKNLLRYPKSELSKEDLKKIDWMKFKIIVPNEREKEKLCAALKYLHDSDIDTDFVWINQLVHCYEDGNPNVIVEKD